MRQTCIGAAKQIKEILSACSLLPQMISLLAENYRRDHSLCANINLTPVLCVLNSEMKGNKRINEKKVQRLEAAHTTVKRGEKKYPRPTLNGQSSNRNSVI